MASDLRARLEAGGLAALSEGAPDDLPHDTVSARRYESPALPGRVVVRLVPDAIALGADTEMGLMSFGAAGPRAAPLARQRRRALGFPGTALVIDPDHARYALEVMREWKAHAKKIQSKPGHAKEGFDAIGERLSRQVPHFLPSYYEEVARAFANGGNQAYAASAFDKARAAEREFGLEVDEERRAEAFLEFSLLGALTVKSIQAYGKELQRLAGANPAFDRMVALAVRRTQGGVAPWASMPKDLRSLAKSAKRDVDAEDRRFLAEIAGSAALRRAPASFWSEYRDAWVALCRERPALRGRLLDLFPTGGKNRYSWRDQDDGFVDAWMSLLADAGCLDVLWEDGPAEAMPPGGRAAWLLRLQEWARSGDGWTLPIARRARAKLLADGVPVPIAGSGWYQPVDLDLVDLLGELGVPWAFATAHRRVDLERWAAGKPSPARHGLPAERRPRDPVHAAAAEGIRAELDAAIDRVFGSAAFEAVAAGGRGTADARRRWLLGQITALSDSVPAAELALGRLEKATTPAHFAEFPDALDALRAASAGRAVARTLRCGLLEELSWPAFDHAIAVLGGSDGMVARVQWPHVILANPRKVVVLTGDRVALEHDLRHGHPGAAPAWLAYVGGRLLVCWSYWSAGQVRTAYWSDAPADTFEHGLGWIQSFPAFPVEHADAVVIGLGRLTAGDRALPQQSMQFLDRDGAWVVADGVVQRQDRETGKPLGKGTPGFLQEIADWSRSRYHPVDDAVRGDAGAVVGVLEGQYGFRLARTESGEVRAEALTGASAPSALALGGGAHPVQLLVTLPGDPAPRAVAFENRYHAGRYATRLFLGDAAEGRVASVTEDVPYPPFDAFHRLRPVDPAASAALRALADDADVLADGPLAGVPEGRLGAAVDRVRAAGRALDDRLRRLLAARSDGRAPAAGAPAAGAAVSDADAANLLRNVRRYGAWGTGSPTAAIATLGAFLTQGERGEAVATSSLEPWDWLGLIRGIAVALARPELTDAQRAQGAAILEAWAASGLAEPGWRFRAGRVAFDGLDLPWVCTVVDEGKKALASAWRQDDGAAGRWFFHGAGAGADGQPNTAWFVESAAPGAGWGTLHGARTEVRSEGAAGDDRDWLGRFVAALRTRGSYPVARAAVERLAERTGLSPTEAAVVACGFPQAEIGKDLREALGLKHAEVKTSCERFRDLSLADKARVLEALAPSPDALWEGGDVDAAAEAWVRRFGRGVAVDEALLVVAGRELGRQGPSLVAGFANAASWELLKREPAPAQAGPAKPRATYAASDLSSVVTTAAWLSIRLPVGDPLRVEIPGVVAAARERFARPGTWLDAGAWYAGDEKDQKVAKSWFDALPHASTAGTDGGHGRTDVKTDDVLWIGLSSHRLEVAFRPGALDPANRAVLDGFARLASRSDAIDALDRLASPDFDALVARCGASPLPPGSWEQDPTRSVPEVVEDVVATLGLSPEAAALWLAFLALLDPTRKNVSAWFGWTAKTYDGAARELLARGLVIEGKRARAGRDHFLPGGWDDGTTPSETWKRPLYGWKGEGWSLRLPLPTAPVHTTFQRAWIRAKAGDMPKFEEVRR